MLATEVDAVAQKKRCKVNTVETFGSVDSKVIFTLLTEVIIFLVGLITIYVK